MRQPAEWARVRHGDTPLDLLHARITEPYAPHLHGQYAIGACTDGVEAISYRGGMHRAWPGTVVVLEPGEVHGGAPGIPEGFAYRVMYPGPAVFGERMPHFGAAVFDDPELAGRLRRAHRLLSERCEPLEGESLLVDMLGDLVLRHAEPAAARDLAYRAPPSTSGRPGAGLARRVMERLGDDAREPPSLEVLAAELGLSRYQVLRGFAAEVGMPPYAWLAQHRVARARGLLERGDRPGDVAAAIGFTDQAHLTRWFRRVVGVTPAAYRAGVRDAW